MTGIDPDRTRFAVPQQVIDSTVRLVAEPGAAGYEGSALWIGHVDEGDTAIVTRVHRPEQVAHATPMGLAVTLTEKGLTNLIMSLAVDELVLARIHTHGTDDVDHSLIDDRNLVVAHPGAVSIVIPRFARYGMNLALCGVHVLSADHHWRRIGADETSRRIEIR